MTTAVLPDEAFAGALAALPRMTSRRLRLVLDAFASPHDAHRAVCGHDRMPPALAWLRDDPDLRATWQAAAAADPPAALWQRCATLGVRIHIVRSEPALAVLADDIDPPSVLFTMGDVAALAGRRAAIVGTRNATADARRIASALGHDLADAGVHVVSGLARGIDGCAHRGALRADDGAGPVAVVGSGLDVVYPPEHRDLWSAVAQRGLLISEAAPGTAPEPFRFPLRNRILAALSEVVVVVESRARGGSLITVDAALDRQVPVMAVPGSLRNPAAAGTNALLRDGAAAVLDAADVLLALGLDHRRSGPPAPDPRPPLTPGDDEVLAACGDGGRTLDQLVLLTSRPIDEVALTLSRLERAGWIVEGNGWFETVGTPR